ncbi:MAG: UDP-N-acetylmuramate--L-alanine ligase [Candidatus Coproplasma sp.]
MVKSEVCECNSFYFVGIGGVSMSALAKMLLKSGKIVAGYDRVDGQFVQSLRALGVDVSLDLNVDISEFDCIVYTDAVASNNKILLNARRLNKLVVSRGSLLAGICKQFSSITAVAGCHGKTTCTSMIAHVFKAANLDFSAHVGGEDLLFENAYVGGTDYFVTEACEFKRNFLLLNPDIALILNSDVDHLDCYGSAENLKDAYRLFANQSKTAISLYGEGVGGEITFGLDDRATFYAKKVRNEKGFFNFIAYERGRELGKVTLSVPGKHNVLNALAAIAVARTLGLEFDNISNGINRFKGVGRRFEYIGKINGASCIADYAHHPNEIKAALKTARLVTSGDLYVVFQPHTYSRTKMLFRQFVGVLSSVKRLLVYKTYAAREYYDDAGSALTLSSALKRSKYGDCPEDICVFTDNCRQGDVILFLGAGDIYDIAKGIIKG